MTSRLVDLVDAYSRRIYPAVLEQHSGTSVSSPLGIWLLLAACTTGAVGSYLDALESALGCSAKEANELLADFLADPPPAAATAVALWVDAAEQTQTLLDWRKGLPLQVETGSLPSQAEADAWVQRHTLGLMKHFPVQMSDLPRLVLASVLATKVTWARPMDVVAADKCLSEVSPWSHQVNYLLTDRSPHQYTMLVRTEAAGIVGVHFADAFEDLAVMSVSADPALSRHDAFQAAHEVMKLNRTDTLKERRCSLFDIPLGAGHSWVISEREVATVTPGKRIERIGGATLPAWRAESSLDLKRSELFGVEPALDALLGLIGPHPLGDITKAVQWAAASFTR